MHTYQELEHRSGDASVAIRTRHQPGDKSGGQGPELYVEIYGKSVCGN